MQSFFWLRVEVLLQTMEHRRPRRTTLMFVQIILLLAASVVYYQKYFFDTQQPESSGRLDVGTLGVRPPEALDHGSEEGGQNEMSNFNYSRGVIVIIIDFTPKVRTTIYFL